MKQKNYLLKFKKNFKKLRRNIFLKNVKLFFKKDYDVIVFANFNFYNNFNIKIFKDILESYNVKYSYIKSSDFIFFVKNNIKEHIFSTNNIKQLSKLISKKNINISNNVFNMLSLWKSPFSKNFNIILFLKNEDINSNILDILKVNTKFDPLYLKYRTHSTLISYNHLVEQIIKKEKGLGSLKPLACNIANYNSIRILKILTHNQKELNNNNI